MRTAGGSQPGDGKSDAVLAAFGDLLDEAPRFEHRDEPRHGGFVHTELGRDLGDSGVTQLSQDVENLESAVDGLHSGGRVALALVVLTLRHRPRSLYAHRVRRADLLYAEPASRASTQWWNSAM